MTAYLIVRAEVADAADRDGFDRWYRDEHLPEAVETFEALRGWRGWSDVDASVHYAFYEFDDVARVRATLDRAASKALIAGFDARWGERATRTRDVLERLESVPA